MSFDGKDFVSLARKWYDEAKIASDNSAPLRLGEAILRTVIGNAYYGVFLVVRDRFIKYEPSSLLPGDGREHNFIREELKKDPTTLDREALASALLRLHEQRKKADYNKPFGNILRVAETAVNDAEDALALIATLWP